MGTCPGAPKSLVCFDRKEGCPSMQSDARIQDVLHTLSNPEDFVRGILGSFINEGFDRDEAVVRIGILGPGAAPHYCIEQGSKTSALG
jgi:hypothetical protein